MNQENYIEIKIETQLKPPPAQRVRQCFFRFRFHGFSTTDQRARSTTATTNAHQPREFPSAVGHAGDTYPSVPKIQYTVCVVTFAEEILISWDRVVSRRRPVPGIKQAQDKPPAFTSIALPRESKSKTVSV